ncbi:tetratricopeptide repeat protein [Candidatus Magnetomonas plexicatena]|uniref:tetratricopeptide repeat protein n=1 Tax=Candidatus Magnetomonas plexicatena TaxID=2552947 RepID=UPI0011025802|nr:tetratricopeptide repeat protein [Nitrospirales bacterium LBB_01]
MKSVLMCLFVFAFVGIVSAMEIKYQEALVYYEKTVELDPQNALYLNDTGCIYHTLGQYQKAIDYFISFSRAVAVEHRKIN